MKKIWKIRKNSEAVSPVIATILMVAITVVLAAVLYVMVMGFSGPGTQTPTAAVTATKMIGTEYRITLISISSSDVAKADVLPIITGGVAGAGWTMAGAHLGAGDSFTVNCTAGPVSILIRHIPSNGAMVTYAFTATV
jgi:flagellin-like protein